MWHWYLDNNPSDLMLTILFICNTINIIGCILLLATIYKVEKKSKKRKEKTLLRENLPQAERSR